jgi:hypothetical protein
MRFAMVSLATRVLHVVIGRRIEFVFFEQGFCHRRKEVTCQPRSIPSM